jgi:hypothetical protein
VLCVFFWAIPGVPDVLFQAETFSIDGLPNFTAYFTFQNSDQRRAVCMHVAVSTAWCCGFVYKGAEILYLTIKNDGFANCLALKRIRMLT